MVDAVSCVAREDYLRVYPMHRCSCTWGQSTFHGSLRSTIEFSHASAKISIYWLLTTAGTVAVTVATAPGMYANSITSCSMWRQGPGERFTDWRVVCICSKMDVATLVTWTQTRSPSPVHTTYASNTFVFALFLNTMMVLTRSATRTPRWHHILRSSWSIFLFKWMCEITDIA